MKRLFRVNNVPSFVSAARIYEQLRDIGPIRRMMVRFDSKKDGSGVCLVEMANAEHVRLARAALSEYKLTG